MTLLERVRTSAELVAFHHTIFALPFAFMGMILAAGGWPPIEKVALITLAMVGARTAAMAFNRLADERFDRENPRTSGRPLPSGRLSRTWVTGLLVLSAATFIAAAAGLNRLCMWLSPIALVVVTTYSLSKRVTPLTHLHLGVSLGLAPVGAWLGITGRIETPPLLLGLAVALWTAGFDVIYACQDVEFDRRVGLRSLPARLGVAHALHVSSALHVLMVVALAALAVVHPMGWAFAIGVAGVAAVLVIEHRIVRPDDLSRVNAAFFTANGWVSVGLLAATVIDLMAR